MRRIHRWVGLVSAVFMVLVAGIGLLIDLDLFRRRRAGGRHGWFWH